MTHVPLRFTCPAAGTPETLKAWVVLGHPPETLCLLGTLCQRWGASSGHPMVGPWRPGVTSLKLTTGSEWCVSLSAGASNKLGVGDACHMSQSGAGGRALGPGHRDSRTPGGSRWGPPLRRDPGAGTHLTEPRQLPFSFSWLRLGRCTPGGQRRERSETKPYPSLTSLHPPETSVPLGP